jgi:hypothetical protein
MWIPTVADGNPEREAALREYEASDPRPMNMGEKEAFRAGWECAHEKARPVATCSKCGSDGNISCREPACPLAIVAQPGPVAATKARAQAVIDALPPGSPDYRHGLNTAVDALDDAGLLGAPVVAANPHIGSPVFTPDELEAIGRAGASAPLACTKARAAVALYNAGFEEISDVVDTLEAAHLFLSEEQAAEIDLCVRILEEAAHDGQKWPNARAWALRLATAVRKAGIAPAIRGKVTP